MKRDSSGKGFSHLGKDGVFRTMSGAYKVLDARGLRPDEIKQFLAIVPDELADPEMIKALEGVDGSKVTSYKDLYEPAPGILPEKPTEEEAKQLQEVVEKRNREILERQAGTAMPNQDC